LQARICLEIIEKEAIADFDILYFTQNNSDTNLAYFEQLERNSVRSLYLYVPQKRPDLLNHLLAIWNLRWK
jgi:N-acetyllactosaminide alpha-2,3-sialyltransferase